MDFLEQSLSSVAHPEALQQALAASRQDKDPFLRAGKEQLAALGFSAIDSLKLLASDRSSAKYGYSLNGDTLDHLLTLVETHPEGSDLKACFDRPFLLVKACWIYEHAPFFLLRGTTDPKQIDALILNFGKEYRKHVLHPATSFADVAPVLNPQRLYRTTFWDSQALDPVQLILETATAHLLGMELSVDFHPFNLARQLPEEIPPEKRWEIREACLKARVKLDIHSPIVGPYVPNPDPGKGKQRFFDPARCLDLQLDVVDLARDIGAESMVVHLIDPSNIRALARIVEHAAGSDLRVTVENYCQLPDQQTSLAFLSAMEELYAALPEDVRRHNFGITLDVGHLNIEGEDPLVGAERIGRWCRDRGVYLRMHATDNYGRLLFGPPHYSADVHANVSGRGINNGLIIRMLRSMGLQFNVVAEQIRPLAAEDIATIHDAQVAPMERSFDACVSVGKARLQAAEIGTFLEKQYTEKEAYQFLAGLQDVAALREYVVYRRIQDKKHLSVDEARRISQDFMRMPDSLKNDLTTYIDDLLLPVQTESGAIHKTQLDLVCQNFSGALFWTVSSEHMSDIFSHDRVLDAGEVICTQGEVGHEMFFVKEGAVNIFINNSCVAVLGAGEMIGEISLFYNIPRSATVKAAQDGTRVGVLTREDLTELLKSRQPYAYELIFRLYTVLPERLRNINDKYRTAMQKLYLVLGASDEEIAHPENAAQQTLWQETKLLPTLAADDVRQITDKTRTLEAGQIVFDEGDEADGMYFLLDGQVRASVLGTDGAWLALGDIHAGEVFGDMALVDAKPRSARIETLTDCKMAFISKDVFHSFIRGRTDLAFRLMGFICLSMFRRILALDHVYSELKQTSRELLKKRKGDASESTGQIDLMQTLLEHRLQQTDLDRILQDLSSTDRRELVAKIGGLLRRISAMIEVNSRMSDSLSLDVLLPRLMGIVTDALNADRSTLFLNDPDTGELFSRVAQGDVVGEIRFPNAAGIAGASFTSGEPILIDDAYADPRFNPEVDRKTGYRTHNILCAPLRNKGKIIGVTQVLNKRDGDFDEMDLSLMETLTAQAASTLENAQLYEKVEKARKEEAQLLEITSVIASELHLDTLLSKVIHAATDMLDADRSTLFMFDPKTGALWSRIAEGLNVKEIRFPSTAGIAGHCFTSGMVVNIPDAYSDARFNPEVDRKTGYRTRNILCMPVLNKEGRKLAVVQVLNKKGGPFGPMDEKRLRTFTAQVAIALENAQLFEDVTNERNYNESILRSLSNGVVTLNAEQTIIKVNEAAQRILDWKPEKVLGLRLGEALGDTHSLWLRESLHKVATSGQVDIAMDVELTAASGRPVSVNATVVPLVDPADKPLGYMVVMEDLTREKRVKSTMSRYMTKELLDRVLESGEDALGGNSQVASVLFSDIRKFTSISERLGARETVSLLNEYFTHMIDVIFAHNGILDKYIGDAIMALFGTPFPSPADADNAVTVGIGMIRELQQFNRKQAEQGKHTIQIGIGINTGELVVGNIGSPKRMEYTVIGDTVNLSARLEAATKYYGVPLLISEFTFNALTRPALCRPLDQIRVMGKQLPVTVYEVLTQTSGEVPQLATALAAFEQGLALYRKREWTRALNCFNSALEAKPADGPSTLYIGRCKHYAANPPPESWDGVWTMEQK